MAAKTIPYFPPKKTRAHEVYGPGAWFFAVVLAEELGGRVIWVREGWQSVEINPLGFSEILNPVNLLVAKTADQLEVLAVAEEALRSGAVPLVVMELSKPLGLTEGRRLQLAARDGKSTALVIIPEGMGSNAAETRWLTEPIFDPSDSTLQRWDLKKNKSGTLGVWHVRWDRASRRLNLVSTPGERSGFCECVRLTDHSP